MRYRCALIRKSIVDCGLRMPVIKLQSSDGEIFEVEVDIAKASNTIKTMIEGMNLNLRANCSTYLHPLY